MQQAYLITFVSKQNSEIIRKYIRDNYTPRAMISEGTYIVVSAKTVTQIRNDILTVSAPGDKVLVLRSGALAAWSNLSDEVSNWLKKYL